MLNREAVHTGKPDNVTVENDGLIFLAAFAKVHTKCF